MYKRQEYDKATITSLTKTMWWHFSDKSDWCLRRHLIT